jgi:hypothetical protein
MITFELPARTENGGLRGLSLGSCRVRNPLLVLRDRGELLTGPECPAPSHTAAEALQNLAVVQGERAVPEHLSRYVFESDPGPAIEGVARRLRQGIDVFVLEVSDDKQFTFGDLCLNQNHVTRNLVQAHRGALLDWYREVCRGSAPKEETVQSALGRLRDGCFDYGADMADLLRGVRLERRGGDETIETIGVLTSKMPGWWVIVGLFTVEGDEGDVMRRRRALNDALRVAAERYDARFYDPSDLVVRYGRETVLDAGGANIYEYAPAFYGTVGKALVTQVRAVAPPVESAPHSPWIAEATRMAPFDTSIAAFAETATRLTRKTRRWLDRRLDKTRRSD